MPVVLGSGWQGGLLVGQVAEDRVSNQRLLVGEGGLFYSMEGCMDVIC